jgi:LmbE family N-acetylglucosaminyl deacetylase
MRFILFALLISLNTAVLGRIKDTAGTKSAVLIDAGHLTTSTQFTPQIFVNTTSVWDIKQKLIRCHKCQNPDDVLVKEAYETDKAYGALNRTKYAEGFIPEYPLSGGRWDTNKKIRCSLLDL